MMASNRGSDGSVESDFLEFVLNFLDDDFVNIEEDEHVSIEELTTEAKYNCDICKKKYKTETWLSKHKALKHNVNVNNGQTDIQEQSQEQAEIQLHREQIIRLVKESQVDISKDECYPDIIRKTAGDYCFDDSNLLGKEIQMLWAALCRNCDAEKFYSSFYQSVVLNARKYFKSLESPVCTLLATRLADKLLAHFNKPSKVQDIPNKPITERETDALQYLSGYVIHALVRKVYKFSDYKSTQSQNLLTLLYAAKSDNISDQRLVASQTRGGLWSVTSECVQVFKFVEEEFRKITSAGHVTKVDGKQISENLVQRVDIVSTFETMVHGCTNSISKETRICLLKKMIQLYLRVRTFSYAKDITRSQAAKKKALRKDIKKKSKSET